MAIRLNSRGFLIMTLGWFFISAGTAVAQDGRRPDAGMRPPAMAHPPRIGRPHLFRPVPFPFFRFGPPVVPPPAVIYVPSPPVIYVLPAASAPNLYYVAPPRVEPVREIVFPTGRWEQRGDGETSPRVWVWLPTYRPPQLTPVTEQPTPVAPPSP